MKRRSREQLYRLILEACPDIEIGLTRKVGHASGGPFNRLLKDMVEKGLLTADWEPPKGFTEGRRGKVKVYRATEKGRRLNFKQDNVNEGS